MGQFEVIEAGEEQLPLVAFKLAEERNYDEFDIASQVAAERGWMVPAYTLPPDAQDVKMMRALVKETLSHALASTLADDIAEALRHARAEGRPARIRAQARQERHRLLINVDTSSFFVWRWLRLSRDPGRTRRTSQTGCCR